MKKTEGKDGLTLQELDESLVKQQFLIEHESYRKDQWEPLKHFRSKYDAEYPISESILSAADITSRKRDMDKLTMNAIRLCILNDEHERVFSYMDLLYYSQSLKMCVQLCEQLNAFELSQKIAKFVNDKEQKEMMLETYKATTKTNAGQNSLEQRKMLKTAMTNGGEKPDLSQFAINPAPVQQVPVRVETEMKDSSETISN